MRKQPLLTKPIKFTYEDYVHFPEDKRCEIIDGEVYMVPAPVPYHQDVLRKLMVILNEFVEKNGLGRVYFAPCDVVLSEIDIVQPDMLFVSRERLPIITEKNIQGAPDLIIEIVSPSSDYEDRVIKRKLYSKYGVKEYWLVELEKGEVEVMALRESGLEVVKTYSRGDVLESLILEELTVELHEIF
ncbi:MAG: Uma2 family endonuclease [bacterium]